MPVFFSIGIEVLWERASSCIYDKFTNGSCLWSHPCEASPFFCREEGQVSDGGWRIQQARKNQNRTYLWKLESTHVFIVSFPLSCSPTHMSSSVCLSGCMRHSNHLHLLWPRLWQWPLTKPRWGLTDLFFWFRRFFACGCVCVSFQGCEWLRKDSDPVWLFVCDVFRGSRGLVRTVSGFFQQNRNYLTIKSGIHPCVYFVFPTLPFFSPHVFISVSVRLREIQQSPTSSMTSPVPSMMSPVAMTFDKTPVRPDRFFSPFLYSTFVYLWVCVNFRDESGLRKDPGSCLFVCVVCRDSGGLARTPNNSGLGFVSACFYARFFFQLGSRSCEKGRLPASMTSSPMAAAFDDTPVRPHLFFAGKRGRWVMEDEA